MKNQESRWEIIKGYFNCIPDKENEAETVAQMCSDAIFHGAKLWVLIFAIFICSLGLNVNSTAVVIGAMLISPLMGPIIGMGLGIGIIDLDLLRRSIKNYLIASVISVLTATLYFLVTPLTEAQSELLARTSPTLYDVLIALCGGAAGIVAISTKGKNNVIPGVAIATALMPPLCTAGYGIARGEMFYFLGAIYLFFINTVFICLATFVGVRMLKFTPKKFVEPARFKKVKRYIILIVVITMLPAAYITVGIIKRSVTQNSMLKFIKNEMAFNGTQIISHNLDPQQKTLTIVAVGKTLSQHDIDRAEEKLGDYKLNTYKLNVIQGALTDSTVLSNVLHNLNVVNNVADKQIMQQSAELQDMEKQLGRYTRYETLDKNISDEIVAVWPQVTTISLAPTTETRTDSARTQLRYVVAIVGTDRKIPYTEKEKMRKWIKARVQADSLRLIVTE